jgi:outer membrane protein assembly factor BamE (lipoprotein component of BamABCDE complex)
MKIAPWFAAMALAGCVSFSGATLAPGTPEAQVRATMGAPAMEMRDPDGTRLLYYPRGPLGNQTYVAAIGPEGNLREIENVLTDGRFNGIRAGLTEQQVLRMIGPPREKGYFSNLQQTAWDYKFQDSWGYDSILSVMVNPQGIVVGKVTRRIDRYEKGR